MIDNFVEIVRWGYDDALYSRREKVGTKTGLVFDSQTKVVYYKGIEHFDRSYVGYLAPYISENGKYCRFIDHQIVEIV